MPDLLTADNFPQMVAQLAGGDPALRALVNRSGLPPFWQRPAGFAGLVRIILEQQVSLASAKAAFDRLRLARPDLSPASFLSLDEVELRQIGFSRQKAGYCRGVAQAVLAGDLDLDGLTALDDDSARTVLVQLKGIGVWTADIYLLLALGRADLWPVQDLGLIGGVRRVYDLPQPPTHEALLELGQRFRPYRSAATRLFWHCYLS